MYSLEEGKISQLDVVDVTVQNLLRQSGAIVQNGYAQVQNLSEILRIGHVQRGSNRIGQTFHYREKGLGGFDGSILGHALRQLQ